MFKIIALSILLIFNVTTANAENMTKSEVRSIIEEYIKENPKTIIESLSKHQVKLEEAERKKIFSESAKGLFDLRSPSLGDKNGDIRVVEFFDYNCGYCRKSFATVLKLVKKDKRVKVILKEYPILGPGSLLASKWALAAQKQGRYMEFHTALMSYNGRVNLRALEKTAKSLGMNIKRLKQDSNSEDVLEAIENNRAIGRSMDINGTPAFVIEDELFPGNLDLKNLEDVIKEKRAKKKK